MIPVASPGKSNREQGRLSGPEVDSFYHLRGCNLADRECQGTACFVARNALGDPHPSDEPRVYCLGRCFESPVVGLADSLPNIEVHSSEAIVLGRIVQGGARTMDEYVRLGGYRALQLAMAAGQDSVLDAVERSGLRGRGGAGFSTGLKWRSAARQPSSPKYIVANADEGDAGAFSDRVLMELDPHALLEGMAIAAYATGATQGRIYLRQEYPAALAALDFAILEARQSGILRGELAFDVEVVVGHGSYLCGEESALLLSLEGRRPEVMARPPYPTEHGLFGQPTITNNVETFAAIPWIIAHGAAAYAAHGIPNSRGTKLLSLNSLFTRPGLYEVEFGTPLRTVIEEMGGGLRAGRLKGVIIGGPLAGIVPPHLLDTLIGFDELAAIGAGVGHGGVVAFDESTSIASLIEHVFSFGAYESCGKCTPCRLGSRRIERIFADAARGRSEQFEWRELVSALHRTSLCGHGTGLAAFAESVLHYYKPELDECFA